MDHGQWRPTPVLRATPSMVMPREHVSRTTPGVGHRPHAVSRAVASKIDDTVESRYLELRYLEFCEIRSVFVNQK